MVSKGLFHRRARRGSPARDATASALLASSGDFQWIRLVRFDCDPGIALSTLADGQTPRNRDARHLLISTPANDVNRGNSPWTCCRTRTP